MNAHKRIILDFDDTLAHAVNRDWGNAKPNTQLIDKTNKLFDDGWTIDIFTARGSISCNSREEASAKYQPEMEQWLKKNGVKYHSISFNKPLAAYYIDDKAMTPEDFVNVCIQKLEGGLSGSDIYTDGKMVHKQDKNVHIVHSWYNSVQGINVPFIDRVVGDTITMEYIDHDKNFFKHNFYIAIGLIQDTLNSLRTNLAPIDNLTFDDYCHRIMDHAKASEQDRFIEVAKMIFEFKLNRSFSHGDFGITNMLFTKDQRLFLIDPIPNVFGCTELDAAKFIASLIINRYPEYQISMSMKAMAVYNNIDPVVFKYLVASEIIRVYKYHSDKTFITECVEYVFK